MSVPQVLTMLVLAVLFVLVVLATPLIWRRNDATRPGPGAKAGARMSAPRRMRRAPACRRPPVTVAAVGHGPAPGQPMPAGRGARGPAGPPCGQENP
jgi:hypothetical protein